MRVTVEYTAQLKRAAGKGREEVELDEPATVADALRQLADGHDEAFRRIVLTGESKPQAALLAFIDDDPIRLDSDRLLQEGQVLTLISPISGG